MILQVHGMSERRIHISQLSMSVSRRDSITVCMGQVNFYTDELIYKLHVYNKSICIDGN